MYNLECADGTVFDLNAPHPPANFGMKHLDACRQRLAAVEHDNIILRNQVAYLNSILLFYQAHVRIPEPAFTPPPENLMPAANPFPPTPTMDFYPAPPPNSPYPAFTDPPELKPKGIYGSLPSHLKPAIDPPFTKSGPNPFGETKPPRYDGGFAVYAGGPSPFKPNSFK